MFLADLARARQRMLLLQKQQESLPTAIVDKFPKSAVLRVFQLDGAALETEFMKIIRGQLGHVFSVGYESFLYAWQPELELGVSALIYKYSMWDRNQFVGDTLQNVVYRDEAKARRLGKEPFLVASADTAPSLSKKLLYAVLWVLLPYAMKKLESLALGDWGQEPEDSWKRKVAYFVMKAGPVMQVLSLINTVVFLYEGKYRSVVDRALGMRLVYGAQRMNRVVNLAYMNQQVYWTVVFNFFAFILPLLNLSGVARMFRSFRSSARATGQQMQGGEGADNYCPMCRSSPVVLPRIANCGHTFCYYCLTSRLQDASGQESGGFNCPICGVHITSQRNPDPVRPQQQQQR